MRPGDPLWTEKVEERDLAQDPLAMNRVMNRLLEELLPGITTISPRARYISHHLWAARDVIRQENPASRAEFLAGMYQRERILLLVSVLHDEADTNDERNHQEIVGIREGRKIIDWDDDPLPLDFRFFANRGGSFGQAYIGPLKTMGLLEIDEESGFEVPTDKGEELADAYDTLAQSSGLARFAQQESIAQAKLRKLPFDQCLCQVCESESPDRTPLRDHYLGRTPPAGFRTSARSRGQTLLLLLHLTHRLEDDEILGPGTFLDSCYFETIKIDESYKEIDIPNRLSSQAARWKVVRAHDYLTFAAEVVFEAWLAYLETNELDATLAGFKRESLSREVLDHLESYCDVENLEPTTPLSILLEGVWPDGTTEAMLQGEEVATVPMVNPLSEHSLDAALESARDQEDWTQVHAQWPRLTLAMALRFSYPTNEDHDAWAWMTSHTQADLSPARFREELIDLLRKAKTIEDFFEWFINDYVVLQAEEVRRQRATGSTEFRGWFENRGGHWEKTRDYSAGHWSARFYSARSILRDLGLLHPNPSKTQLSSDGEAVLQEDLLGATNAS